MKYRTKQYAVKAFPITKESLQDVSNWPEWFLNAIKKRSDLEGAIWLGPLDKTVLSIREKYEVVSLHYGDYVLISVTGEIIGLREEYFNLHYEKVD